MTQTIIAQSTKSDSLAREAARMQRTAFSGQTYVVEPIDATIFAIVLRDTHGMTVQPMLTPRRPL